MSAASLRRFLLSGDGWPYLLVPFIPIAIVLELTAPATIIFAASALGVIPTAALMAGRPTSSRPARAPASAASSTSRSATRPS